MKKYKLISIPAYSLAYYTGAPTTGGRRIDGRMLRSDVGGGKAASKEHELYCMVHSYWCFRQ